MIFQEKAQLLPPEKSQPWRIVGKTNRIAEKAYGKESLSPFPQRMNAVSQGTEESPPFDLLLPIQLIPIKFQFQKKCSFAIFEITSHFSVRKMNWLFSKLFLCYKNKDEMRIPWIWSDSPWLKLFSWCYNFSSTFTITPDYHTLDQDYSHPGIL